MIALRKASVALMLKTERWLKEMAAVHLRLEHNALQRTAGWLPAFAHKAATPSVAVTGAGTPTLVVVRQDPTAGIVGYLTEQFAPPWNGVACVGRQCRVGVACSVDTVTVCGLPAGRRTHGPRGDDETARRQLPACHRNGGDCGRDHLLLW